MSDLTLDFLGYVASGLVVLSLAMSSVLKLRILSLIGSTAFLVYGLLIDSIPVALTNGIIMMINIVFLQRLFTHEEAFDVVEVDATSKFLARYLEHHHDDVQKAWPGYRYEPHGEQLRLVVFRDMVPAGVFIASVEDDVATVEIDFAGPDYRDLRNARVLFGRGRSVLREHGISKVVTQAHSDLQRRFLLRFGFEPSGNEYALEIG